MKTRIAAVAVAGFIAGLVALGAASTARASHLRVSIAEVTPASVGESSMLDATVTAVDTEQPVAGVPVTFYVHATFGKADGFMEIGKGVTDARGVAVVSYAPRESGTHEIRVEYATPGEAATEQTTGSVAVSGAQAQMYTQTAGIQIPGVNSGLIILVLSIIWALLFGVGLTLIRIAAARGDGAAVSPVGTTTGIARR